MLSLTQSIVNPIAPERSFPKRAILVSKGPPALQHRLPARHRHHCPRDVARLVRRQQHEGWCQLLGLSGRASGACWPKLAAFSAAIVEGMSGVQIGPGATQLTRMPRWPSIWDSPPVKFWIAAFVAA